MNSTHALFLSLVMLSPFSSCSRSEQDTPDDVSLQQPDFMNDARDSLTLEQINDIKSIHNTFAEVMSGSITETISSFRTDDHPEKKIAIWLRMARAYERFAVKVHFEDHDKKDEAFQLLLMRSTMSKEEVLSKRSIHYLNASEVEEIFSYYIDPSGTTPTEK